MELTSEQVHWFFGSVIVALAALLLVAAATGRAQNAVRFVVPGAFVAAGAALIVDLWLHGSMAPANYDDEASQHMVLGVALTGAGVIELDRVWMRSDLLLLKMPIVAALLIAGAAFLFHQQHGGEMSMALVMAQHRIFGATLIVSGGARLWSILNRQDPEIDRAWLLIILLFGVELLFYTETSGMMQ